MENRDELQSILGTLNDLLGSTDLKDVTSETTGYQELADGYYLSEVESAKLTVSKSSKQPMVAFQFKVVEDGKDAEIDEEGNVTITEIKGTKNRKIFLYYVLKDDMSVKRFVNDMLKFEGDEEGVSLLEKEYFTRAELLEDALEVLEGRRIYIQVSTTEKNDGTKSTWQNLISWKRATALELA